MMLRPLEAIGRHAFTVVLVMTYYATTIMMSNSTKFIFERYRFQYPWFLTSLHMFLSSIVARICCKCFLVDYRILSMRDQLRKVVPLAVVQALSIAAGQFALEYLYPSFVEMLGCSLPMFIMVASIVMLGEWCSKGQFVGVVIIVFGSSLCTAGERNGSVVGLVIWFVCMVLKAWKTILQKSLLSEDKLESVTLLMYCAPWEFLVCLGFSFIFEGGGPVNMLMEAETSVLQESLLFSGVNTCLFNICSYMTVRRFSAVGFVILSAIRMPLDITTSVLVFQNSVTAIQLSGCAIIYCGAYLFNVAADVGKKLRDPLGPKMNV